MKFEEYRQYDATGLAALIQSGEVQASELLDIAITRAEQVNPKINALHTPLHDFARQQVNKINNQQVFAGVPFLLKDLQHALKGFPLGNGSMACSGSISTVNASFVDRCLAAGLLPFAKTTTPEFGLLGVTETKAHGATRNPWNLERTPGGSSGGSAAAIAAGIVPMASANDGGGSIRIPASHCGLFGLKPSRARVPTGPHYAEVWMGASADHVLTRSVRDSARMLDALQGIDSGAPFEIKPPATPYAEVIKHRSQKLSIAYTGESPIGTHVDQACVDALQHTLHLLESMGHTVEEARPNYDGMMLAKDYLMLYFANVAAVVRDIRQHSGRQRVKELEAITRALATVGESISAGEFYQSKQNWNTYSRCMGAFYERYDLFLTPAAAMPPIKIGESAPNPLELFALTVSNRMGLGKLLRKSGLIEKMAVDNLKFIPFSQLANLTGLPAMSVPLFWNQDELPVGVQFIAPVGAEDRLLQLAAQLEEANPWFHKVAEV
jgi:amidase